MNARPVKLASGEWAIEFEQTLQWNAATGRYDHGSFWGREADDETFATRAAAIQQIHEWHAEDANETMASRKYQYQQEYAAGIRD